MELGEGVSNVNKCVMLVEEKKLFCRDVKEQKRKMMEENKGLV
jgi:hypothetical protein